MTHDSKNLGPNTRAVHAGQHVDPATGAVAPPIYQSSTFAFQSCRQGAARFAGEEEGFIYTRMGNPTVRRLEEAVTELEGGAGGLATSSGMAALCTIAFALLNAGDHLVGTSSVYGPSRVVMERDFSRFGVRSDFVDTSDLDAVRGAMKPETRIVFIETPANPTIVLTDIAAVATIAHDHGALLVVDNTFASPILQRPLELGADIVLHTMTKFINGHTDVVAGMIVAATRELVDPHQAGSLLPRRLHGPPPGLARAARPEDPGDEGAHRRGQRRAIGLLSGGPPEGRVGPVPGPREPPPARTGDPPDGRTRSLISFEVTGGVEGGEALLDSVRLMTLAVSLGGIETLIQHPPSMTHAAMPRADRLAAGITDGLVRVSVGCEDADDLIADFDQAFANVSG